MKVMSFNANGLRAAQRKGFFEWMLDEDIDIMCIQETKAQTEQLQGDEFCPVGYHRYFHDAEKKGYSGVAIYTRFEPDNVTYGFGWPEFDKEGRFIRADFGGVSVISLYMPSGTSGDERQAVKYDLMDQFLPVLKAYADDPKRDYIICGDWNIAHKQIDIRNWKTNQKNSGFLPEERAWMDRVLGQNEGDAGLVDAFRVVNQEADQYTWWTYRAGAFDRNVGWRIDYHIISSGLRDKVKNTAIYKGVRFSDHAPLTLEYDLKLDSIDNVDA